MGELLIIGPIAAAEIFRSACTVTYLWAERNYSPAFGHENENFIQLLTNLP